MISLGAQYYRPPNPPASDWPRDLSRMREAGFDTVKFWACWSWMQPSPDRVDFGDLDRLMDLAAGRQLRVVINTILENAPYWLEQAHPAARYRDAEDRPVHLTAAMNTPGGGWPGLCFDNPAVLDAAKEFLVRVAERYRHHPALSTWDVWNEPHLEPASYFPDRLYCYCPASLARFAGWLRERYPSLAQLNEAWARRYSGWHQVAPPRQFEAVPDMLDWRAYWFDNLRRQLDIRTSTVRAADPDHPVMTHVALSGFTGQLATHTLDEFTLDEPVDLFGTSSFPAWLMGDDPVEHLFNLDSARAAAGAKPFWQAELQGGRGRRNGLASTGQPSPALLALWMWNALATGASGVVFWQWRPELLGPESPGYGLTAPDGTPTARLRAASAMAQVMSRSELVGRVTGRGTIGLLLSRRAALHAFATDRTMELYTRAALGAYRLLLDADLDVTMLHEDHLAHGGVPPHVTAVYWPMPAVTDEELSARLVAFVAGGGRLLAESGPGEYTPHGRRRTDVPGGGLEGLFGAREIESNTMPQNNIVIGDGSLTMAWQRAELSLAGARVCATFDDGSAAVTEHHYGEGTAVLLASYASVAAHRISPPGSPAALRALLGVPEREPGWVRPVPGLISRTATTAEGRELRFLLNWTAEDAVYRSHWPAEAVVVSGDERHGAHHYPGPEVEVQVPARAGGLLIAHSGY